MSFDVSNYASGVMQRLSTWAYAIRPYAMRHIAPTTTTMDNGALTDPRRVYNEPHRIRIVLGRIDIFARNEQRRIALCRGVCDTPASMSAVSQRTAPHCVV
jgi:hypothetical protein